jgi:hypothetical protein
MSQQQKDGLNEAVVALYFILYKQAGCPHGKSREAFLLWVQLRQAEFEQFCTTEVI